MVQPLDDTFAGTHVTRLPPLILHPFSGAGNSQCLVDGSRAALILEGLMPREGSSDDQLERMLLTGRLQEIRMLFFLGKDLARWVEQCVEIAHRVAGLRKAGIRPQSFSALLTETPPEKLKRKLEAWGVTDQKAVFSRALGMVHLMADVTSVEHMAPTFLRNYHRFADYLYVCYQNLVPFTPLEPERFQFDLFASSEYSQMLSDQWGDLDSPGAVQ